MCGTLVGVSPLEGSWSYHLCLVEFYGDKQPIFFFSFVVCTTNTIKISNSLTYVQVPPKMGIALGHVLSDSTNRGNKWTNYVE